MRSSALVLLGALLAAHLPATASAAPVVPGLAGRHPLSQAETGRLLLGELRCTACHRFEGVSPPLEKAAPNLADVGARVAPEFLRKFLASPATAHPGTTMPDLLAGKSAAERDQIAEALTHFLVARSPRKFGSPPPEVPNPVAGKELFHSIGCVACHSPRADDGKETTTAGVVPLGQIAAKYGPASLAEFLQDPLRVRPAGRMPDLKLTRNEAEALAGYLIGKPTPTRPLAPRADLAALGKEHFKRLDCAACHQLDDIPAPKPVALPRGADPMRGCLSEQPGKGPRYAASADQVKAIRAALEEKAAPASAKTLLATTLTAFNCIACHVRDDYGGVTPERSPHFRTTENDLGEEARIPPPLTLVGAKLRSVALKKTLFDGESVRPYMLTRMPQFGEANLSHLPALFARLDAVEKVELSLPPSETRNEKERLREKEMRAAGRELLGNNALNCVACHTFNGKAANFKGIDLMLSYQRLQPAWFYHYLIDPNAFRPRTVMPTSWPGGQAVLQRVLDGDARRQIEAIWYYLSLGTSAADPAGIRSVPSKIEVADAARTYRGRSNVAGYRGIAVGFPEKLSYAFNAQTGTLSALWRGDFIGVQRGGQGSGAFNPAARAVTLAQDVSFFALPDDRTPWPLRPPPTTKEMPVDPDPLYPRNRGYRFKGYFLDDASIPTFLYRSGTIEIEDRSAPAVAGKNDRLLRRLRFDSPTDQTLWFRALTGDVQAESKQRFRTPELRLSIPPVPTLLRPDSAERKGSELLLRFDIPKGRTTRELTYELLK